MKNVIEKKFCSGCGNCKLICPKDAISIEIDNRGFKQLVIDESKCINCGLCYKSCPQNDYADVVNNSKCYTDYNKKMYSFCNNDKNVLKKSSSGGAFVKITDYLINNNYVVFGASFSDDFTVHHTMASNTIERDSFCGSKYVPSELNNTFVNISDLLKDNERVAFSGTPCQCKALLDFLSVKNISKDNLLLLDFKCHGSGNVTIWNQFKKALEKKYGCISNFSFRYKEKSWEHYPTKISFNNGKELLDSRDARIYTILFLMQYINMPLCYKCPYRNNHFSDITMSDFWEVKKYKPSLYNKLGISLLSLNSEKGESLIKKLFNEEEFKSFKCDINDKGSIDRTDEYKAAEDFWNCYEQRGYNYASKKYTRNEFYHIKISEMIKKTIKKLAF